MSNLHSSTGPADLAQHAFTGMRAVVLGASSELAHVFAGRCLTDDLPLPLEVPANADAALPAVLAGMQIAILAGGTLGYDVARQCPDLKHVILLSEQARNGTDVEMLERLGITPHTVGHPVPATAQALADAAIEQCRRIVSPTGG